MNTVLISSQERREHKWFLMGLILFGVLLFQQALYAQAADANNGINEANRMVRSYFSAGVQLLYGVAAIVGLIGAYKVYASFVAHDGRTQMLATNWFGACIFLILATAALQSFYGV